MCPLDLNRGIGWVIIDENGGGGCRYRYTAMSCGKTRPEYLVKMVLILRFTLSLAEAVSLFGMGKLGWMRDPLR